MRARNTKPGFYTNPVLLDLPADHRLLFLGLGALCDRRGLVEDRPRKIKDAVLRGLDTDVNAALDALANTVDDDGTTLISRYVGANGVRVVKLHKFLVHNKPHCEEPENPTLCDTDGTAGVVRERYPNGPVRAQCRHSSGTVAVQERHALYPVSCIPLPESCMPLPAGTVQAQCPGGMPSLENTGDPGDGTLDPGADSAAVMALLAGTTAAADMDRAGARRGPPAERKPSAVPTQRPAGDRGARGQAAAPPATKDASARPPVPPTTAPAPANPADDDPSPAHSAAYRLAEYLHELDPAITAPPIIDPWAMQLSRLHHRDKRAWDEIDQVMHWAFKVSDWWPPRLLNPANFVRHYAQLRAQWQAEQTAALKTGEPKAAPESPETMRSLYSALEYELSDGGVDDARSWITRQKPDLHKRLTARLDKLVAARGAR